MMIYADKVIINGMTSSTCMPSLLYGSDIGRHTSVLHINRTEQALQSTTFLWEHENQRPNTYTFPLSCPLCRVMHSWCPASSVQREDGAAFTLQCITKDKVTGKRCPGTYEVPARPPTSPVDKRRAGEWHSSTVEERLA